MLIKLVKLIKKLSEKCKFTEDRCTTPYKRQGYCVWADDCPPVDAMINNRRRTRSDSQFIRDSVCETTIINNKAELKVCCDIKGSLNDLIEFLIFTSNLK